MIGVHHIPIPAKLTARTNRILGGHAPSHYLRQLESGKDGDGPALPIAPEVLDGYLKSHLISPQHLRSDDFRAFMADRERQLLTLIQSATGHAIQVAAPEEGEDAAED